MEIETLTPEEVTEKEKLLINFLLNNDFLFQSFSNGLFVQIPKVKVAPEEDKPTS